MDYFNSPEEYEKFGYEGVVPVKLQETLDKAFEKKAGSADRINLLISGTTGIGMGILGIGIPDIPIFTAMVLKSIYEIALSYGFEYESEAERRFIFMLIQGAVSYGSEMLEVNDQIDMYINTSNIPCDYFIRTRKVGRNTSDFNRNRI